MRCKLIVKNRSPPFATGSQTATSGFLESFHAALVGSILPGLRLKNKLEHAQQPNDATHERPSEPPASVMTDVESSEPPTGDVPASFTFSGR